MPRPSQLDQKRRELLPIVAQAFADLGYRRATTAELAARCGVQENILYRLWPGKKEMFIAAIGAVYDGSVDAWRRVLAGGGAGKSSASRLLAHEAANFGRFGHHRIVFAGLNEIDDREIRAALAAMYQRYHRFVCDHVLAHRDRAGTARASSSAPAEASALAWAIIGLGTVTSITKELGLLDDAARRRLMAKTGAMLLDARM